MMKVLRWLLNFYPLLSSEAAPIDQRFFHSDRLEAKVNSHDEETGGKAGKLHGRFLQISGKVSVPIPKCGTVLMDYRPPSRSLLQISLVGGRGSSMSSRSWPCRHFWCRDNGL